MYIKASALLQINDTVISFDDYPMKWRYENTFGNEPNFMEITLPNLSKELTESLESGAIVVFQLGRDNKFGNLITGYVDKVETVVESDFTHTYTLRVIELEDAIFTEVSTSYKKGTKASYIIQDLASMCGVTINSIDLAKDVVYLGGYVAYGKFSNILRKICDTCNSKFSVDGTSITIYNINSDSINSATLVDFDSGLLREAEKFKEKDKPYTHKITMVADTGIRKNSILYVRCDNLTSYVRVHSYTISDFIGEYLVELMEA